MKPWTTASPIESWWPGLSIVHKHSIQEDLDAPLPPEVLEAIGRGGGQGAKLTEEERTFVREQGEQVD